MVYPMAKTNVVSVIGVTILIKSATSNVDVEHIKLNDIVCMCGEDGECELVRPFDIRFHHFDDY